MFLRICNISQGNTCGGDSLIKLQGFRGNRSKLIRSSLLWFTVDLLCKSVDWFLYDRDLRHGIVYIRSEIWIRSLSLSHWIFPNVQDKYQVVTRRYSGKKKKKAILKNFAKFVSACAWVSLLMNLKAAGLQLFEKENPILVFSSFLGTFFRTALLLANSLCHSRRHLLNLIKAYPFDFG